jgi:hypothetical protein
MCAIAFRIVEDGVENKIGAEQTASSFATEAQYATSSVKTVHVSGLGLMYMSYHLTTTGPCFNAIKTGCNKSRALSRSDMVVLFFFFFFFFSVDFFQKKSELHE